MHGPSPSDLQPVAITQLNILIPTLIGVALCGGGVALVAQAFDGVLGGPEVRNAIEGAGGAVLVAAGAVILAVYVPTVRLKENVARLRPLVGRTRDEAVAVLGEPRDVERTADRSTVVRMTWRTLTYCIVLEFTDGVCTVVARKTDAG